MRSTNLRKEQNLNFLLKTKLDELLLLEQEHTKCKKHRYQANRDIAHAYLIQCQKEIIEILKSNYVKLS